MANNVHQYGFRWVGNLYGFPHPKAMLMGVDSAINFTVSGDATNLNLNVGDPVRLTANGTVTLAGGNENSQTSQAPWGVVVGMGPVGFFNGTRMVRQTFLQSGCTYGTNFERQSQVLVVPFSMGYWEIDVDDNTTAAAGTYASYQAFVGENVDHRLIPNASGFVDAQLAANPLINIASHNPATTTLSMRIYDVSKNFSNADFTGLFVKLTVGVNKGQEPFYTNVGV
jgi:hypothetical protein